MDSEWTVNGQCLHRPVGLMCTNFVHFWHHLGSNWAQLGPDAVCSRFWWLKLRRFEAAPDHFGIMLVKRGNEGGPKLGGGRGWKSLGEGGPGAAVTGGRGAETYD